MKTYIRPRYSVFDEARFDALVEKLLYTTYKIGATYEEAPTYTDCVSAIRYIVEHSCQYILPRVYIGDIPKFLVEDGAREIPQALGQKGDLVFFEKMSERHQAYMIAHVGILLGGDEFFHSTIHFGGGKISSLKDIDYNSLILDESFLEIAKDPRNNY